eukprot:11979992-Karenia_brevis.AAC.1
MQMLETGKDVADRNGTNELAEWEESKHRELCTELALPGAAVVEEWETELRPDLLEYSRSAADYLQE